MPKMVTFHSAAAADFSLFHDIAVGLLQLMGHSGTVPGAILADDGPAALSRLHQALARGGAARGGVARVKQALAGAAAGEGDLGRRLQDEERETGQAAVTLTQRAYPLT